MQWKPVLSLIPSNLDERIPYQQKHHTKQMTIQPKKRKKNSKQNKCWSNVYTSVVAKATSAYIYSLHGKKWWFLFCIPFEILPFRNDDGNIHIGMRYKHCAIYEIYFSVIPAYVWKLVAKKWQVLIIYSKHYRN